MKNNKTTITVITVCKNAEKYIAETIESVINQKSLNESFKLQYLIFDGNSSDKTNEIIKRYSSQFSEIEHFIENDEGLYDGLVKGFKKAKGDIVAYINAGDFYNKRSVWNADLGMSAALSKELELGVIIKNATLSKIADYNNERLTTNFQIGASYHFSKDLIVQTGLEKNINYPASFLAAINYKPNEKIIINGGIASNPSLAAFGISLIQKKFTLSFATQIHQYLGWSPDISIIYQFK